ncbi:hypothetical protein [Burkholderia cenocepacia]|uniref:hypothetical protein n=1 Tax=Burkholderia cenocepacia TaxID=95486 RepID=UPI002AB5FB2A|nr:hypothetical protein [Burkholderia cenocepacia]
MGAGEFGIGVPDACAVSVGVAGVVGVAGGAVVVAWARCRGASDVCVRGRGVSGGVSNACASCIGAFDACAAGVGAFVDGAPGCGASGSTTTVVGIAGFGACAICIDASDACAIGVGASGGCVPEPGAACVDAPAGCRSGGNASGAPRDPAISLALPGSASPSAARHGPDATSRHSNGACRRIRRFGGATVVHCC